MARCRGHTLGLARVLSVHFMPPESSLVGAVYTSFCFPFPGQRHACLILGMTYRSCAHCAQHHVYLILVFNVSTHLIVSPFTLVFNAVGRAFIRGLVRKLRRRRVQYRGVAKQVTEVVKQEILRLTPLIPAHTQPATPMPHPPVCANAMVIRARF